MKIDNFKSKKGENKKRVSATITWEDCDRPIQEIYFETDEEFAQDISCNPHAFLVACIMPALRFGEKRISIDAQICPELQDGLTTAMGLIRHWFDWYKPEANMVRIEAKRQKHMPLPSKTKRAAFLFSGGIDSLATLRANRLHYSPEHPGFIRDGLLIYGLEVREPENFEPVLKSVSILAQDTGVTLIPVYTNITDLGPENFRVFWDDFWAHEFMGATFAAVAHTFSNRFESLSINSCHDIPNLIPYGSHPLLNPNYSSSDLKIRHEGIALSRFAKTKLLSDWDLALNHLRVCNRSKFYETGRLNCGKCEKCVRTMLALLALGVLEKTGAFPEHDVTQELLNRAVRLAPNTVPLYGELISPLKEIDRHDLVRAIEKKITLFHQMQKKENSKWRKRIIVPIKELDKTYLNNTIKRLKTLVCN